MSANSLRNMMMQSTTNNHLSIISNHLAFVISTLVVSALQIHLFMQNKANFKKVKLNVTDLLTKNYEKKDTWSSGKNEPKTNPIYHGVASGEAGTNPIYHGVASGEAGTNPIYHGVASGEAGTNPIYHGVASGEAGSKPIYHGVASGEAGTNPIYHGVASPAKPEQTQPVVSLPNLFQRQKMLLSTFLLWNLVRIIMLFKNVYGKCRLKIILAMYPIIW